MESICQYGIIKQECRLSVSSDLLIKFHLQKISLTGELLHSLIPARGVKPTKEPPIICTARKECDFVFKRFFSFWKDITNPCHFTCPSRISVTDVEIRIKEKLLRGLRTTGFIYSGYAIFLPVSVNDWEAELSVKHCLNYPSSRII